MAFSGNNQTLYNDAFNGALAGMLSGRPLASATATDYAAITATATAFATEFDALVATDATLSTGAGGTTIDPVAGVTTASLNAKGHLAFGICFAVWFQRQDTNAGQTAAGYAALAAIAKAVYTEGVAAYANAPGGTSLT